MNTFHTSLLASSLVYMDSIHLFYTTEFVHSKWNSEISHIDEPNNRPECFFSF
jgi:hypothetical protein